MKITSIEIIPLAVDLIQPLRESLALKATYRPSPFRIARVQTDEGLEGFGERFGGDVKQLELDAQAFIGKDPTQLDLQSLQSPFQGAMYDLAGQALGVPVWRLIGDKLRDRVPVAYWSTWMAPEETAKEAEKAYGLGFRVHKLKAKPWDIVRQAELITKATGPDYAIRVDPNCNFVDIATSVKLAHQLEPYNIEVFEDPCRKDDYGWYRQLRAKIDVPVSIHCNSPLDVLRAVQAEAVDYVTVSGNVGCLLRSHGVVEAAGIQMWHQIGGVCAGVQAALAVHMGCTLKNATLPCDEIPFIYVNDLVGGSLVIKDGAFQVPTGPGLGIKLDEAALKHYRVE